MSLSIPFPFGWLLNKKAARVEVNISLAFLHWVGIALHPWPFVSDIAICVLKGDVKLQQTWSIACDILLLACIGLYDSVFFKITILFFVFYFYWFAVFDRMYGVQNWMLTMIILTVIENQGDNALIMNQVLYSVFCVLNAVLLMPLLVRQWSLNYNGKWFAVSLSRWRSQIINGLFACLIDLAWFAYLKIFRIIFIWLTLDAHFFSFLKVEWLLFYNSVFITDLTTVVPRLM